MSRSGKSLMSSNVYQVLLQDCSSAVRALPLTAVEDYKEPLVHISTPRWKYIACNVAQLPCLVFIWLISSLELLLPYYIFYYLARDNLGLGMASIRNICSRSLHYHDDRHHREMGSIRLCC